MSKMSKIPLCRPELSEEELMLIKQVMDSGWLAHGPKVKQFERQFADYIGTKYAVSLNSCASALQAAIMAHGLKGEIILPSFTFAASANAIVNAGCVPVFAEIDEKTFNIDIRDIEKKLTENTVGIMPVHYAGQSCDMDAIMQLARKHDLAVIEDSAEAIGSTFKGKKTGSFGTGCFSFYPTKNMTTGEGGMVTTDDEEIVRKIKAIRGHGIVKGAYERENSNASWLRAAVLPGYNFRMNEIQAAMGLLQLEKLDAFNQKRRELAAYLSEKIITTSLAGPFVDERAQHSYQMYVAKYRGDRDAFVNYLREHDVEASVHFDPPVHLHPYYAETYGLKEGDFPVTEKIARQVVTLPMFPSLTKQQIDTMVEVINSYED